MGSSISNAQTYSANTNILGESDESFFEVGFDELFNNIEFDSELLHKTPDEVIKPLVLPSESVIADIMTDPIAFVSLQTTEEAWNEVLSQLFKDKCYTKPYIHQLLEVLSRFFQDRPIPIIEKEFDRRIGVNEQINADKQIIVRVHNKYGKPKIPINQSLIDSISDSNSVKIKLKEMVEEIVCMEPNILYTPISTKLKDILSKEKNIKMANYLLNWGLNTADVSCVVEFLMNFSTIIENNNSQNKLSSQANQIADFFNNINFSNSINCFPIKNKVHVIPNFTLPKNPSSSAISCDGHQIYILGTQATITVVSLNKGIVNVSSRFRKISLNIPQKEKVSMGFVISCGYAYFFGPFMPKPYVYKLPHFEQVKSDLNYPVSKLSRRSKLRPPFANDGHFIYSFDKKKHNILVFMIKIPKIVLIKSIPVKISDKAFYDTKNLIIFANGTVLTATYFVQEVTNKYQYTLIHISLLDGSVISVNTHIQKWPLFAITYDPWNNRYWELSPGKDQTSLLMFPNNTSQPLWLSDSTAYPSSSYAAIIESISTAKNNKMLYNGICSAITFLAAQFNGCSFKSFLSMSSSTFYNIKIAQFLAPCTNEAIDSFIKAAMFYTSIVLSNPKSNDKSTKLLLIAIMRLLSCNTKNFESRIIPNGNTITFESSEKILKLILDIVSNDNLAFLHRSAGFLFINSFQLIVKEPNDEISKIFMILFNSMPNSFVVYMISQISDCSQYPFIITWRQVREIFHPILTKLITNTIDLSSNQIEFLHSYMRSMMLELLKVYKDNQVDLPPSAKKLNETFNAFANLVYEVTDIFFSKISETYSDERFKFHPFIRFLFKWIIMLETFTKFSRLSTTFTAVLKLFYDSISKHIFKIQVSPKLTSNSKISSVYMMFYEVFLIYSQFLSSLLDGGSELKETSQFLWLIKSTIEGKVTPKEIDELVIGIKESSQKTKHNKLLRKGFSFNIIDNYSAESDALGSFVAKLSHRDEIQPVKQLMDYLYKKVNNPLNKRLTDEDRWIDRLILSAFAKQLGVSSEIMYISLKVSQNETPIISHFIKQLMESIYRLRRILRQSKQATIQFRAKCEQNLTPVIPEKNGRKP
ncbi:hypothetical protein TRFO_24349 [Tritrichomonas foetus]|uniref:HECT domain-containing protein n=1 Tax=Tritrichomonas foetus TaxID=1144522 RepID=A0A1J4K933_9EUKA|nr:hypothetical protein TRFO_24349 [Tritrichomonas foetus]|eukprot:OHT07450.1 hypothetical protein TRFO_24349 [Tritrichomonas foetus]